MTTSRLDAFLAENELDDLDRRLFADPTPAETAALIEAVTAWAPRQAIFNLLLNVSMLPEPVRAGAVIRALDQRDDPWLALGAAVGLQGARDIGVPWPRLRDRIATLIGSPLSILDNRASVTLAVRAQPGDGQALAAAAARVSDDDPVLGNLLAGMLRINADAEAGVVIPRVIDTIRYPPSVDWLAQWMVIGRRPREPMPALLALPGLGYIPNLPVPPVRDADGDRPRGAAPVPGDPLDLGETGNASGPVSPTLDRLVGLFLDAGEATRAGRPSHPRFLWWAIATSPPTPTIPAPTGQRPTLPSSCRGHRLPSGTSKRSHSMSMPSSRAGAP